MSDENGGDDKPDELSDIDLGSISSIPILSRAVVLRRYGRDVRQVATLMLFLLLSGMVVVGIGAPKAWTTGILWSLACAVLGWTVGFYPKQAGTKLPSGEGQEMGSVTDQFVRGQRQGRPAARGRLPECPRPHP
jgi:hypothetical protein